MQDAGQAERERLIARFGKHFSKGDVIFREGDAANEAFLLQEGRVRLVRKVRGIERSLSALRPGELFGETALVDGATRTSSALALTDGTALALDQTTFRRLIETSPSIAARVVQQLVRRLRDAEDQVETMMMRGTQSRIVNALLKLAQANHPGKHACTLAISPLDLATRVGLDVETVRKSVQQLRDGNYLRVVAEQVEIPDMDALTRLHSLLSMKEEIRGGDSSTPPPPAEAER